MGVKNWTKSLIAHFGNISEIIPILPVSLICFAVDVTSNIVGSPTINEVISAVVHAYYIIEQQRNESTSCVARQSVYCDADLANFEISAAGEIAEKMALTAATYEVSQSRLRVRFVLVLCYWHYPSFYLSHGYTDNVFIEDAESGQALKAQKTIS